MSEKENRHSSEEGCLFFYIGIVTIAILNILVPQVGQTPWVAGLPFFMVIALAFFISFLARHFTHKPAF